MRVCTHLSEALDRLRDVAQSFPSIWKVYGVCIIVQSFPRNSGCRDAVATKLTTWEQHAILYGICQTDG